MVISLGVYSIFRHTHMVNNHGKTTNNGWFSQKNTSWERGWSGRHRGQLGQTRHQSRTLKCCFATKTRFWNMNLPEKMGLLIICFICFIELCFIICIYIYVFLPNKFWFVPRNIRLRRFEPGSLCLPSSHCINKAQQGVLGQNDCRELIIVKVWEWWLWYVYI